MKEVTYDLTQIIDMSDNDPDFIKLMVDTFMQEMPSDLDYLAMAMEKEDRENVHNYAHKMRPSLEMFGLKGHLNALALESWAKGEEIKDVNESFNFLYQELQETLIQLKNDF